MDTYESKNSLTEGLYLYRRQ